MSGARGANPGGITFGRFWGLVARAGTWASRAVLVTFSLLLATVAAGRAVLAVAASPAASGAFVAVAAAAAACTFILEGLAVASGRLREVDAEALERHARAAYPRHLTKICDLGHVIRGGGYQHFLIGQQVLTILLVLGMQYALERLAAAPSLACAAAIAPSCGAQEWMASHMAWGPLGPTWLESQPVTFLISSLLVCWLFQLAPSLLAEGREVGFLRFPLTRSVLSVGRLASMLQLGYPGQALARAAIKLPWLGASDPVGLSAREVFEDLKRTVGVCITRYEVSIELYDDRTTVSETTEYEFHGGSTQSFEHKINPPMPLPGDVICDVGPPELASETDTKRIIENLSRIDAQDQETLSQVICWEIALLKAIPQPSLPHEAVRVSTCYDLGPLAAGSGRSARFDFYAQRPMRIMEVSIFERGRIRIEEQPDIKVKYSGELASSRNENRAEPVITQSRGQVRFTLEYLVHGARAEIRLQDRTI